MHRRSRDTATAPGHAGVAKVARNGKTAKASLLRATNSLPGVSQPGPGRSKDKGKGRTHAAQTALAAKRAEDGRRRVPKDSSHTLETRWTSW